MDIKFQEQEKTLTVTLTGKLNSLNAPEAEEQLMPHLAEDEYDTVVFDCKDLTYIASSGLRFFFATMMKVSEKEGRIVLKDASPFVRSVFDQTGLSSEFEFE